MDTTSKTNKSDFQYFYRPSNTLLRQIHQNDRMSHPSDTMTTSALLREIYEVKKMIMELKASIDDIRNVIGHPDCIEIRDIPYIQAKDEIRMFFKNNHGKEYYPSELMEQLGIEYSMVSKICEELRIEGNVQ